MNKKENNKKIKIYLVPHSHWDREWYFTYDCSNALLENNFNDLENITSQKWFLDGQWSLVDDAIKWKQNRLGIIKEEFKKNNLSSGPLYTQPDVFNSQAETIIRNFEIGKKVANKIGAKQLETAYLPDTFGFGPNFPQILKHCNIKNFVFWRGLKQEQIDKNLFFNWKGIDKTEIKSYVLRDGYYSMGMYYPYNDNPEDFKQKDIKNFLIKTSERVKNISGEHEDYILPLGGDQAPFIFNQKAFVQNLNNQSEDFEFILENNYDSYFKNKNVNNVFSGSLRTPITGKIHRTIASSRYDIKRSFREAEDRLFYLLEPLEIFYKSHDSYYDFEEYKDENIIKPLLVAQTHDSLGGCNTDVTNRHQLIRLERIKENIDSQIDLLIKKLLQSSKTKEENIVIFNPAPFKNNIYKVITVFSGQNNNLNIYKKNLTIKSISSQNISLDSSKPLYKNEIAVVARNLKPLSLSKFNVAKNDELIKSSPFNLKSNENKFKLKLGNEIIYIYFDLIEDKGDSYDFSPGKEIPVKVDIESSNVSKLNDVEFIELEGKINKLNFKIYLFKEDKKIKIKAFIDNKLKNSRLSINIDTDVKNSSIKKSLNLAMIDFEDSDFQKDWKKYLKEYPAHVDVQDGIVVLNNKINIFTKGTNEIYKNDHGVKIVLYRSFGDVTGKNLAWRPSTSGLSWKEPSPEAQLQKELEFDFEINVEDLISSYNSFKMEPYLYKVQNDNFIANKMNKFVINNIFGNSKPISIILKTPNVYISSMRLINNEVWVRIANMENKNKECILVKNNQENKFKLKEYEIKHIKLKG